MGFVTATIIHEITRINRADTGIINATGIFNEVTSNKQGPTKK